MDFNEVKKTLVLTTQSVKMSEYIIPSDIIRTFVSVASRNYSDLDGKHVETLSFLAGHKHNNTFTVTDIVIPRQIGGPLSVDDQGTYIKIQGYF